MAKNNVTVNKANKIKASFGSILFDTFNHIFLGLVAIICLYPLLYVLWASLSDPLSLMKHTGILWAPLQPPTLWGYRLTMQNKNILVGYKNTLFLVVVGTFLNVFFTAMAGYVLSRKTYLWRNLIMALITFTMFFGGGMIPTFLLVKGIGLYDSRWALIIPGHLLSAMNVILVRTYMRTSIPGAIYEAAKIDGANYFTIFWKIVLPLSKPILVTISVFTGLGYWNDWTNCLYYISDRKYMNIQGFLNKMIQDIQALLTNPDADASAIANIPQVSIRMAIAFVALIPILIIYPFLQKYFASGIALGAVKG